MNNISLPELLLGVLLLIIFGLFFLSPIVCAIWLYIANKPTPKGLIGTSSIAIFLWIFAAPKLFPAFFGAIGATLYGLYHGIMPLLTMIYWRILLNKRQSLKTTKG